ncbi:MAG: type II toxin-antitoxin system HicB family antitoxin [Candidatus Tectomicrobia bacterium]|uniref:Type II toxin-antitoxin system HicB family antitoxin n=1 Tax=Tectimicrobiota bacterium TaxID=2528274 RepID=A0A937W2Q4_UNCTE|nr:type II toxin-antitoxin system HicB family antitoxin [Candidatus Tectomicrobia bacterium]
MKYLVVIEKTATGFSAYSPDLVGCIATGATPQAIEQTMREAMAFHLEGLALEGQAPPPPQAYAQYIELSA